MVHDNDGTFYGPSGTGRKRRTLRRRRIIIQVQQFGNCDKSLLFAFICLLFYYFLSSLRTMHTGIYIINIITMRVMYIARTRARLLCRSRSRSLTIHQMVVVSSITRKINHTRRRVQIRCLCVCVPTCKEHKCFWYTHCTMLHTYMCLSVFRVIILYVHRLNRFFFMALRRIYKTKVLEHYPGRGAAKPHETNFRAVYSIKEKPNGKNSRTRPFRFGCIAFVRTKRTRFFLSSRFRSDRAIHRPRAFFLKRSGHCLEAAVNSISLFSSTIQVHIFGTTFTSYDDEKITRGKSVAKNIQPINVETHGKYRVKN